MKNFCFKLLINCTIAAVHQRWLKSTWKDLSGFNLSKDLRGAFFLRTNLDGIFKGKMQHKSSFLINA